MAKDQGVNLLTAVIGLLRQNSALVTLAPDDESPTRARVYNGLPDKPVYPYLRVETVDSDDWSVKGAAGSVQSFRVHGFSQDRGQWQAHELIDAVEDALHDADLSANVSNFVMCLHIRSQDVSDPEEGVWHRFAEFDVWHQA